VVPLPPPTTPTVTIMANPASINQGSSSTLTVTATNATTVMVTGTDGTTYALTGTGGTQIVTPKTTTTYQATATGPGGQATAQTIVTVIPAPTPTVTITANPTSLALGNSSVLTVTATNATTVTVTGTDGSSYSLATTGGTQSVTPKATTTYTATATGPAGNATGTATVTVIPPGTLQSVDHVIFMLQENHTFDNYFGMLNPYRVSNGWNIGDDGKAYNVDGIDDKLKTIVNQTDEGTSYSPFKLATTCVDDMSSAWLESYGDVSRYSFLTSRSILMDGFVHDAEGFAKSCVASGTCSGSFTDTAGQRAMGYYDETYLNYYYYMASQFAVSNRWFSPVSSKSIPNRIATFTGGTTQGLVYDPGTDDKLPQLNINTIYNELDHPPNNAPAISWKIYYTVTNGGCTAGTACGSGPANYPDTTFSILSYSYQYMYGNPTAAACTGTTKPSSVVGDPSNSFCVDPTHIAPLSTYFQDVANGTLPAYSFIESGSGVNDEHPGSGQSVLTGQAQVANVINKLMSSPSWKDSVFFFAYDEGGGPYDHVPPVTGHSNDFTTDATVTAAAPDIGGIAVNPDAFGPCVPATSTPTAPATTNCDLRASDPGAGSGDAPTKQGFAAQLGFRVPNMIVSPFARRHYVGNNPMDHTAILKFVENRFIGSSAHLTARDAAQPDLTDFFDFTTVPWATPPTTMPTPVPVGSSCNAAKLQ
jgi:phospholipase C